MAPMHKAVARHMLARAGWTEPEIGMATRVLRHNASRRSPRVLEVIRAFASAIDEPGERASWDTLVGRLEADPAQRDALVALLAL